MLTMQTTHWGVLGTFLVPIANAAFTSICGHSIDITQISWVAEISAILVTIGGFYTEHVNPPVSSPSIPTPSTVTLTPDG